MRATGPTAWPPHASTHLIETDLDTPLSRLFFPGRRDPTDPLVSRQRGDCRPEACHRCVGFDGPAEVRRQLVDRAARDCFASQVAHSLRSAPALGERRIEW